MRDYQKHLTFIVAFLTLNFLAFQFIGGPLTLGPLKIISVTNPGFLLGLYEDANPLIRIVLVSVLMGIMTSLFVLLYSILNPTLLRLRWGMSFYLSGVLGNGIEKLMYGVVRDYLSFDLPLVSRYAFNLSDVIQIIGIGIIIYEIFRNQDRIWFPLELNKRNWKILYAEIQIPFMIKILLLSILGDLTQGALIISFLFPYLDAVIKGQFLLFFLFLAIINLSLLGFFLIKELHRFLGPIYALEKHLRDRKTNELRLRQMDHFKELAEVYNSVLIRKDTLD